ncbi:rod shape-determining protein MreD [Clostridiales Family XIII bacterium PM5-7]
MKYGKAFLLYLAMFFLQMILKHAVPIVGEHINLLLCLTVVMSFLYDDRFPGIAFGLIFGLASDALYGLYAGPGTVALVLTGIAVYVLKDYVNIGHFLIVPVVSVFSTWLFTSIYWVIYFFIGSPYTYLFAIKTLPLQLLFDLVAIAIMFLIMEKRKEKHRRDRYFR